MRNGWMPAKVAGLIVGLLGAAMAEGESKAEAARKANQEVAAEQIKASRDKQVRKENSQEGKLEEDPAKVLRKENAKKRSKARKERLKETREQARTSMEAAVAELKTRREAKRSRSSQPADVGKRAKAAPEK